MLNFNHIQSSPHLLSRSQDLHDFFSSFHRPKAEKRAKSCFNFFFTKYKKGWLCHRHAKSQHNVLNEMKRALWFFYAFLCVSWDDHDHDNEKRRARLESRFRGEAKGYCDVRAGINFQFIFICAKFWEISPRFPHQSALAFRDIKTWHRSHAARSTLFSLVLRVKISLSTRVFRSCSSFASDPCQFN